MEVDILNNVFITDLKISICNTKLNEILKNKKSEGVYGKVNDSNSKFRLIKRSKYYHNSYQRVFCGKLENYNEKTIITGKFKLSRSVKAIIIYFNIFLLFCMGVLSYAIFKSNDYLKKTHYTKGLILIIVVYILSYLMVYILTILGKSGEKYILEILKKELKAKEFKQSN